jgi:hypothetical protein
MYEHGTTTLSSLMFLILMAQAHFSSGMLPMEIIHYTCIMIIALLGKQSYEGQVFSDIHSNNFKSLLSELRGDLKELHEEELDPLEEDFLEMGRV